MSTANSSNTDPCSKALGPSPDGAPPNFNGVTFQPISIGIGSSLMIIAIAAVSLRIADAFRKNCRLHFEDYSCGLALMFSIANAVITMIDDKTSRHVWDTSQCSGSDVASAKRGAALMFLYPSSLFFAKAAICALYLQLFSSVKVIRYTALGILVLFGCAYVVALALATVYSFPWHQDWEWGRDRPDSWSMRHFIVLLGFITVITDIVLLLLPIRTIVKLNTSTRKKIALITVFMTGFGATIAATVNLYFRVSYYYFNVSDFTWVGAWLQLSAEIELFVTITLACVPGCISAWRNKFRDTVAISRIRSLLTRAQPSKQQGSSLSNMFPKANKRFSRKFNLGKQDHGVSEDDTEQLQLKTVTLDRTVIRQKRAPDINASDQV